MPCGPSDRASMTACPRRALLACGQRSGPALPRPWEAQHMGLPTFWSLGTLPIKGNIKVRTESVALDSFGRSRVLVSGHGPDDRLVEVECEQCYGAGVRMESLLTADEVVAAVHRLWDEDALTSENTGRIALAHDHGGEPF